MTPPVPDHCDAGPAGDPVTAHSAGTPHRGPTTSGT